MFKKIFRGVRNALKGPAGILGLGALALGPLGGASALSSLFGSGAMKGVMGKYGIPALLGLVTAGALKGEGKEEAVSFDDFESQTTKKYGDKFGGSPFRGEQFLDLMFEPGSSQYFDYRNPQGILENYQFDEDDKIIERKKGGIAELNMGGNPFMDRQRISGSMGGGMNPGGYSPDPTIKSITGYNPNKPRRLKKGGFPDMSGDGKVTKKDVLIGRGVIRRRGGGIAKRGFGIAK